MLLPLLLLAYPYSFKIALPSGVLRGMLAADLRAQATPAGPFQNVKVKGDILDPKGSDAACGRPTVGFVKFHGKPFLWVMTYGDMSNTSWNFAIVNLFRLANGRWTLLRPKKDLEYTGRGCFQFTKDGILMWDYDADHEGRVEPSRYICSLYVPKGSKLVCSWKQMTKGYYRPHNDQDQTWILPDVVPAKDDPLREFGYRWQWWAKPL